MKQFFLMCILFYTRWLSPLFPPCCRYYPTCSEYAYLAIKKYGVLRGGTMACKRLASCHPWSAGGCDELPEEKQKITQ